MMISEELLLLSQGCHCNRSGFRCSVCDNTEHTSIAPMTNSAGFRSGGINPIFQNLRIGARLIVERGEL